MPYLGDYLGQIMSEICMARMQADLETVRIAELYATHPLLRTMPIPHVRLPDVELDVPVLIKDSEEPRSGESPRGGVPAQKIREKLLEKVVGDHLDKSGIRLTPADKASLRVALNQALAPHSAPTEISVDIGGWADRMTSAAMQAVSQLRLPAGEAPPLSGPGLEELKDALRLELVKLRTPPPRLTALVTSAELREAASSDNVTRLRLKVTEQGVEWTRIEGNGGSQERLVPE